MKRNSENRLCVGSLGWAEDIPAWLLDDIKAERLALGLAAIARPDMPEEVGIAEACAYLMTASLRAPMPSVLNEIYFWVTATLMKARTPGELPDFMAAKLTQGLTRYEQDEYTELRRELYRKRGGRFTHPLLDELRRMAPANPLKPSGK